MFSEHRRECALAGIATVEGNIDNPLAVCYSAKGEQETRLLAPLRKAHARLFHKKTVDGFRSYVQPSSPLAGSGSIGWVIDQRFADHSDAGVAGNRKV